MFGTDRGGVQRYDVRSGQAWRATQYHGRYEVVDAVAIGVLGDLAVLASATSVDPARTVKLWDFRTGAPMGDPIRNPSLIQSLAVVVVDDQLIVVSGCLDGTLRRWDVRTGAPRGEPLEHGGYLEAMTAGLVDGQPVIVSTGKGHIRIWDARDGAPLRAPLPASDRSSLAIGTVGDHLVIVAGCFSGAVSVWGVHRRPRRAPASRRGYLISGPGSTEAGSLESGGGHARA